MVISAKSSVVNTASTKVRMPAPLIKRNTIADFANTYQTSTTCLMSSGSDQGLRSLCVFHVSFVFIVCFQKDNSYLQIMNQYKITIKCH